jgi:hypothetical protein
MASSTSDSGTFSASPFMYTAWPVEMGAPESKMTALTSEWDSTLREWAASGDETLGGPPSSVPPVLLGASCDEPTASESDGTEVER